jgi:Fic family protein
MNPQDFRDPSTGKPVRMPQGYWAFLPAALPPELTWPAGLVSLLAEAERALARLAAAGATFPEPYALVRPFVRREAVLSSRIEGTRASLADVYAYEAGQMSFLKPGSDVREVHNYVRALDYGLERLQTLPVSLRLIREIHARLMEGVRGGAWTPGEFRRSQNWIGPAGATLETATYVPPPVEEMNAALDRLEKFVHTPSDLPPLVRIGLIHYQFEAIHPFLDGNGRVGRLLIALLLCQWELLPQPLLYLSAYFECNRAEYYDRLLTISRGGEWEAWLRFFLTGVRDQALESAGRVKLLQGLREHYRDLLAARRDAARLGQVLDFLLGHPIASVRQVQAGLGLGDYKTVLRYVGKLEQAGILREVTGGKRNRLYRADEILETIEGPLSGSAQN